MKIEFFTEIDVSLDVIFDIQKILEPYNNGEPIRVNLINEKDPTIDYEIEIIRPYVNISENK